ncbi:MAG: threonine ammonia-lyase [Desulfobacteraceae bacterium]|nr:MAG: threonine ammonia-lyase [Desulfobacteraceae bacterium]
MKTEPALDDILQAAEKQKGVIDPSPVVRSGYLSRLFDCEVFLKLENLQETGSFKVRGAFNRIRLLKSDERERGVVAASAGNHAQGVAWAATRLGISALVVMPEDVSLRKLLSVKEYGAEVILKGTCYDDAYEHAVVLAAETGRTLIPAFNDIHVMAGQGTIGLELSHLLDKDTAVVVPIGGGGLISGIAVAAKSICQEVKILGAQTESYPSVLRALGKDPAGHSRIGPTIADGIAVKKPGDLNLSIIREWVDEVVAVDEETIAGAVLDLLDKSSVVAEGAGAASVAAVMSAKFASRAKRLIFIISGGNIEIHTMDRILHRGSIRMGRLIKLEVNLPDSPGSLWRLLGLVAEKKANILHIFHDRLNLANPIQVSRVTLSLETRGHDHAGEIVEALQGAGYDVMFRPAVSGGKEENRNQEVAPTERP